MVVFLSCSSTGSGDHMQRRAAVQGPHAQVCLRDAVADERSSTQVVFHDEEDDGGQFQSEKRIARICKSTLEASTRM